MFRINRLTVLALLSCTMGGIAMAEQPLPSILPRPARMTAREGVFRISADTPVVARGDAAVEAGKLIDTLAPAMGYRLRPVGDTTAPGRAIHLVLDATREKELGTEGYSLDVQTDGIEIHAAKPAGLFYAVQTLRQLLPPDVFRNAPVQDIKWTVPCVSITDTPRFSWRGLLIDPARHFIPKRDMMRFIDAMVLHKFNRLQIHFTDGQGWRIEIKKYPLLTQVGSRWHNSMSDKRDQARIYGGFYTQDDIRELVRYAADRHVTIVPEIEMPHHAGSAMVAYPQIGFNVEKLAALPPEQRWGKVGNTIVPRPVTVAFFQDVLDEIVEMFPSPYIHIGGDEANAGRWAELPEMQALMKEKGLEDVHELHSWFIRQMDSHLTKRGRRLVGWDEILQGGLADDATVMSWRGIQGGISAANAGHDVIMTPTSHTYFDYRQAADAATEPPSFGGSVIDLAKVYTFEPIPDGLDADRAKYILGGQAQLWGELIPNEQHREYQTYPRACALIETVWSAKEHRDYAEFLDRLRHHLKRLDAAGIHYRRLDEPAEE
ncbi:MAG: beta-N-acetylhexosaminidase [Thermoguttaceae bacterium]